MDALRGLTEGQGCAPDGTAASANPLSQLVNQTLGMAQKGRPAPFQGGPMGAAARADLAQQQTEAERGLNAAMAGQRGGFGGPMGAMGGPMGRGPMTMGGGPSPAAAQFEQQFRGAGVPQQALGPRGYPAGPMGGMWVRDFERMRLQDPMARAWGAQAGPWAAEMVRGPTPAQLEMERVWRQQQDADGSAWAKQMAAEMADAAKQAVSFSSLPFARRRCRCRCRRPAWGRG